jgi:hypothetical protein
VRLSPGQSGDPGFAAERRRDGVPGTGGVFGVFSEKVLMAGSESNSNALWDPRPGAAAAFPFTMAGVPALAGAFDGAAAAGRAVLERAATLVVGLDLEVDFDARDGAAFLATRALGPAFFTAFRFVGTRVPFPLGDLDLPDLTARLGLRVEDFLAMEGPPEPVSADDRGCPGHPNRCSETDQGKVCETVQVSGRDARLPVRDALPDLRP